MTGHTVAVIGGGITGVGVARDLAMRGASVTVLERGAFGAGATGHSHGLLHSGARYALDDPTVARECAEENRLLRDLAPACVNETGGYLLGLDGDPAGHFDRQLAACRDCGIEVNERDAESVRDEEPSLAADVRRVAAVPDAVVSPRRLLAATAVSAHRHGATLRDGTSVIGADRHDGRIVGLTLTSDAGHERLAVDHVVNAAGAWAGRVAATMGLPVRMRPTRGVLVVVNHELRRVLNRSRPPDDGDIAVPVGPATILGTTSEPVDDPDEGTATDEEAQRVIEACAAMCPALGSAPVVRTFAGVRPLYAPEGTDEGSGRDVGRGFAVLDHATRDGTAGVTTVVGGKLTIYRLMAEAAADAVAEAVGLDVTCRTATTPLPGDDGAALDRHADRLGVVSPAG